MEVLPIMSAKKQPICYIVAGPNGAGKTTFALQYLPKIVSCNNFINADEIAKGVSRWTLKPVCYRQARFFCNLWTRKLRTKKLLPLKQHFPGGYIWRRYRNGSKMDGKLFWSISTFPVLNFQRSGCNRDLNRAVIMFQRRQSSAAIPEVSRIYSYTLKYATRLSVSTTNKKW